MGADADTDRIDRVADVLMQVAGDQNVRALEAIATALANRLAQGGGFDDHPPEPGGLAEGADVWRGERWDLCRRIARRALRGSLADLTGGAAVFHRIDADPPWARRLLPVAVFGSFLFYRSPEPADGSPSSPATGAEHDPVFAPRDQVERVLDGGRRRRHADRE